MEDNVSVVFPPYYGAVFLGNIVAYICDLGVEMSIISTSCIFHLLQDFMIVILYIVIFNICIPFHQDQRQ